MFEKNLQDLVKGIRSTKGDVSIYISQCMQEIKNELKSTDPFVKAQAVRKLTYLHMLGYDMCWAAFHVVEVMSYERFSHKRIGYTAACQSFTQSTDVILLCTNLLKKEFGSINEYEVGLAINVLANIATTDLARDLLGDVVAMMMSPKAYVRKKAVLVLYKIYLRYPQGLRLTFDKLKERMEEPDVSVVSCAVNVICELANKKPKNYLGLAPHFFRLLTTSSNNWMLIKVVKLMASLVPEEPRLARKLLDPLATIIQNTPAKSLLYECISTVTTALLYTKKSDGSQPRNVPAVVRLCNDHLRRYIEDPDQNLRYLGLVGLSNLMKSHPYVIAEHQELIIECLAVDDITIRMRSLELLAGIVNPENASQIIRELMRQTLSADGLYRHELITRILHVCSVNKYENVHDFDWYIQVLVQLARLPGHVTSEGLVSSTIAEIGSGSDHKPVSHGVEVSRQLVDIAVRVKSVRSVMVDNMMDLLLEKDAMSGPGAATLCEVYYAAAWISGEYVMEYLEEVEDEDDSESEEDEEDKLQRIHDLVDELLQPKTTSLPPHVQTVYIQNLLKFVNALVAKATEEEVENVASLIIDRLGAFIQSEHIEVQERACCLSETLLGLGLGLTSLSDEERASRAFDSSVNSSGIDANALMKVLNSFFSERLAPVGLKAQRKVPLPGDLDLDDPIDSREAQFLESGGDLGGGFSNDDDLEVTFVQNVGPAGGFNGGGFGSESRPGGFYDTRASDSESESDSESSDADSGEEKQRQYEREKERMRTDPFYLSGNPNANASNKQNEFMEIMDAFESGSKSKKKSKKQGKKKKSAYTVLEDEMMPEGARGSNSSDEEGSKKHRSKKKSGGGNLLMDETDLSAVDLSIPLGENEKIPDEHLFHRQVPIVEPQEDRSKHKKKHRKKEDDGKKKKSKSADDTEKKSSGHRHHRHSHKRESKENVYGDANEEEARTRHSNSAAKKGSSSSRKKSSKSATDDRGDDGSKRHHHRHRHHDDHDQPGNSHTSSSKDKERKKKSKSSSSKEPKSKVKEEPLLLF